VFGQTYLNFTSLFLVAFLPLFFGAGDLFAQSPDTLRRELTIDFKLRPRAEYRDNFMWTAADTVMPDLYTTLRNRLSITYNTNRLRLHASPQEIHVWDEPGRIGHVGSVNFFELYAEPTITKNFF